MLTVLLSLVALAGPYDPADTWLPGTLGALPQPWAVAVSPSEDAVAILDGLGRVTLADARTLAVRWQVPVARGEAQVHGALSFGPRGLAVAAGPRDAAVRVAILDPRDGRMEPLGRTPEGARVLDLRWLEAGDLMTRTREPEADNPLDTLMERTWGPAPTEREIGLWTPATRVQAAAADRTFVDNTVRSLGKSGTLQVDVRYRVWDDPWEPTSARPLKDCPEWSEVVHVSDDGRFAYTMGRVRCVYDLDTAEVVAWETKQVPFWSALSGDGAHVVERHGKGGRRWGVVRDAHTGEVVLEIDDMEGATFTADAGVLAWTTRRLSLINLADGAVRWSVPLDGDARDVRVSPDAGSVALLEQVTVDGLPRLRILSARDGKLQATVHDVLGLRGFSEGGRLLLLDVRSDHLGIVDLRAPTSSIQPTHRAGVQAVEVDNQGVVTSGDDEGRVLRAHGPTVQAWQVPGRVQDLVVADGDVITTSQVPGETGGEGEAGLSRWTVARRPAEGDGDVRLAPLASGAAGAWITQDGHHVVVFHPDGTAELAPTNKGRAQVLPTFEGRGGARGPRPQVIATLADADRFVGVPAAGGDKAYAWSLTRKAPTATYALGIGTPALVAADSRRVLVLDGRGGGRVFDGGNSIELALSDDAADPCCAAVGGGVVVVATGRDVVHVHDATTGDRVQVIDPIFAASISAVDVAPDGDWIVVASEGGELATFRR